MKVGTKTPGCDFLPQVSIGRRNDPYIHMPNCSIPNPQELPLLQEAEQLLRFLETGELRPVGENKVRHVDVRIVAATNRDLRAEIAAGRFRADLYDRIAKFPLTLPPLRERPEDIPLLAEHFLSQESAKSGNHIRSIAQAAMRALCHYHFPGNVRELENELERAVILADGQNLN